ncbi:MAG TPA: hypothetical protein VK815_02845 [Candidatus Acidoferrales bacterium]|nr:hypothetical protein [Candidatus Acidoferrales bacterium]
MDTARTPVSKYAGIVATGVWTLGWVVGACHAVQHVKTASNRAVMLNLFVTFACSALGVIMTYRIARPGQIWNIRRRRKSRKHPSHC